MTMLLKCIYGSICGTLRGEADFDALAKSGVECQQLAEETVKTANKTKQRCDKVVTFCKDVKSTFEGMRSDPRVAVKLIGYRDEVQTTIAFAREMDDLALECAEKAKGMNTAIETGLRSLPRATREMIENEVGEERDIETKRDRELMDVDGATRELEICNRDIMDMNALTAAQRGNAAFDGLATNGDRILQMFDRIQELSASIVRISSSIIQQQSCCAQLFATAAQAKEMLRCVRMAAVISKMATAAQRLIGALIRPIQTAWDKFGVILDELNAAKKIKNFFGGMNPQGLFNRRSIDVQ